MEKNILQNNEQAVKTLQQWVAPQITEIEIAGGLTPGLPEDATYADS